MIHTLLNLSRKSWRNNCDSFPFGWDVHSCLNSSGNLLNKHDTGYDRSNGGRVISREGKLSRQTQVNIVGIKDKTIAHNHMYQIISQNFILFLVKLVYLSKKNSKER